MEAMWGLGKTRHSTALQGGCAASCCASLAVTSVRTSNVRTPKLADEDLSLTYVLRSCRAPQPSDRSLSAGAIAGIVIAAVVFAAALAAGKQCISLRDIPCTIAVLAPCLSCTVRGRVRGPLISIGIPASEHKATSQS